MRLPGILATLIFHILYTYMRRKDGARFPPIRRKLTRVDYGCQQAFDVLLDATLGADPRLAA